MKQVYPVSIESGASQTGNYLLMLYEPVSKMQVPIIIGPNEAQGILLSKQRVKTKRPMTHEVMMAVMEAYGLRLKEVTIDRVVEGIFYASLHVSDGFNEKSIDCRSSDAITLALYGEVPIMMEEHVLEETGVRRTENGEWGTENGERRTESLEELEEELHRCEEAEDYERAAEIQKKIEEVKVRSYGKI